ncbi:MAG: segregation/condensation protein A [Clostridiales bacterium]|jgi:segregation and condensation protein A|nr:segregation/condensation protein A [Clostridiales bacterium]
MKQGIFKRPVLLVRLDAYEGPFDLLLGLLEKNSISIYDIPISEIADQYIEIIKGFPEDMEFISEFIIMAATLLEIKSRMLIPESSKGDAKGEDPRSLLVNRLLEYRRYKKISLMLRELDAKGTMQLFKGPEADIVEDFKARPKVGLDEALGSLSLGELERIYKEVLARRENRTDKIRAGFGDIPKDAYTIEEKLDYLRKIIEAKARLNFTKVLHGCLDKSEKVVMFLALLELIRNFSVEVTQEDVFSEIIIEKTAASRGDYANAY